MSRKRKRARNHDQNPAKRQKAAEISHPVLRCYYAKTITLRTYILCQLPDAAREARKRIRCLDESDKYKDIAQWIDSVIIGCGTTSSISHEAIKAQELALFTQQRTESTLATSSAIPSQDFPEIVNRVIWLLFGRETNRYWPSHLLCQGYRRAGGPVTANQPIPGLVHSNPSHRVETMKGKFWCDLCRILGPAGERIMEELLLNCGIFVPVECGRGSYYQLSGIPLSELQAFEKLHNSEPNLRKEVVAKSKPDQDAVLRSPSEIRFVRSRILYARPAYKPGGFINFGLHPNHVFNRLHDVENSAELCHILKYIFPRQFGLHNVFTFKVDRNETALASKDYTFREGEIADATLKIRPGLKGPEKFPAIIPSTVPKRLKPGAKVLVGRLRKRHRRCPYRILLLHYCKTNDKRLGQGIGPDFPNQCLTEFATPVAHVSAFCRAIVARVFPSDCWGSRQNAECIMKLIDQFLRIRKRETLSLHNVMEGIQQSTIAWVSSSPTTPDAKVGKFEALKRKEIFLELVYYLFDSFLIPLIRSNFYVTESNVDKQQLFYFRHDVWRKLTIPYIKEFKSNMFEPVPRESTDQLLRSTAAGVGSVRLLPKKSGVRMITNLRKRWQVRDGKRVMLGRSINYSLKPIFNALKYEKLLDPSRLGSSLFSVADIYPRLADFRRALGMTSNQPQKLYFAKVDVQSCFDTIPQEALLHHVSKILSLDEYAFKSHYETRMLGNTDPWLTYHARQGDHANGKALNKPITIWNEHAQRIGDETPFPDRIRALHTSAKNSAVFLDAPNEKTEDRRTLLASLQEHLKYSAVKIGNTLYRRRKGVPQGSILSALLCNFFYADFEDKKLRFLQEDDGGNPKSVLLRLIDDFLLISTNKDYVRRFLKIMHNGEPDWGIKVQREKTLVNAEGLAEQESVGLVREGQYFLYCGLYIDTETLEVRRRPAKEGHDGMKDSLTVEYTQVPGRSFYRRTLNGFKVQIKGSLLDSSFNSTTTVLSNLYQSFLDAACRCLHYWSELPKAQKLGQQLLMRTIDALIALGVTSTCRRPTRRVGREIRRSRKDDKNSLFDVPMPDGKFRRADHRLPCESHVQWLGYLAFEQTFGQKQTAHAGLLAWLSRQRRVAWRGHSIADYHWMMRLVGDAESKARNQLP